MRSNIEYDNIDDRKEIYNMLNNYMKENERRLFLEWCCSMCGKMGTVLRPGKSSIYDSKEVYWQLMLLAYTHGLNLDNATAELIKRCRKK